MRKSGAVIVSWTFNGDDKLLLVGVASGKNGEVMPINAYQGEDAQKVHDLLTIPADQQPKKPSFVPIRAAGDKCELCGEDIVKEIHTSNYACTNPKCKLYHGAFEYYGKLEVLKEMKAEKNRRMK